MNMGREINLLKSLPKNERKISERSNIKNDEVIEIARQFGQEYFDGSRNYGYGGYKYDGRWRSVVRDLIEEYDITGGMNILDIGCAKGFLLKDFKDQIPELNVFGIDISEYAIRNCHPEVVGKIYQGNATNLLFPDNSFDLVVSINTLHNLDRIHLVRALSEIQRVSKGSSYIVVDSYTTPYEKEVFENWVLTAKFHDYPKGWLDVFQEAGYTGDYSWTIIK
jgi:ubiquinone/menaquinone biosynthesis C-methylase UbiE